MKQLFLLFLLVVPFCSKGQICNFCSEEEIKEELNEQHIEFQEKVSINGEKCLIENNENYTKSWYFRYGQCYLYDIKTTKKNYSKSIRKILNSNYLPTSDSTWEDSENKVEMMTGKDYRKFVFVPKLSSTTINK
jgi:hypothetical protein